MGIFVTCGFPSLADTVPLMHAIDRAGADFIELGMPFSDPLGEGKPIQRSSEIALANGANLGTAVDAVANFRETSQTPVLLMGYINPIFRYGISRFCERAASAGVDGLILPDLPPDESPEMAVAADNNNLSLVHLIAPNTPEARIKQISDASTGFVYAVSFTGLTGAKLDSGETVQDYLRRARGLVSKPLLVGFGIRSAQDAATMTAHTDGFIVGSALIENIERFREDPALDPHARLNEVESFVRSLRPQRNEEQASIGGV